MEEDLDRTGYLCSDRYHTWNCIFPKISALVKRIDSVTIEDIDLMQIADGIYAGEFGDFLVKAQLEVTVQEHRITEIKIIDQRASPGHEALETIDRILKRNHPKSM